MHRFHVRRLHIMLAGWLLLPSRAHQLDPVIDAVALADLVVGGGIGNQAPAYEQVARFLIQLLQNQRRELVPTRTMYPKLQRAQARLQTLRPSRDDRPAIRLVVALSGGRRAPGTLRASPGGGCCPQRGAGFGIGC
jgi:hypothetical protein